MIHEDNGAPRLDCNRAGRIEAGPASRLSGQVLAHDRADHRLIGVDGPGEAFGHDKVIRQPPGGQSVDQMQQPLSGDDDIGGSEPDREGLRGVGRGQCAGDDTGHVAGAQLELHQLREGEAEALVGAGVKDHASDGRAGVGESHGFAVAIGGGSRRSSDAFAGDLDRERHGG